MGDRWKEMTFGDCAELVRDTCQPTDTLGMPYIGLEHIGEGTLKLNSVGIAEDTTSTKSRFKAGDILFGKLRPYFRKVIRPKIDGICSTDIWVVRAKEGVDQGFLFYWMASKEFVEIANQGSEGTKMPRAKWDFVSKIKERIPPLPEQKAIASILGALDDKIELNRKINETLESMARAIFKSWFVDFDPIPGFGPHKEWQDSPLGKIPKGWRVLTLGDIAELYRNTINPLNFPDEVFEHFSIPAFDVRQMPTHDLGSSIKSNKFILPDHCVLVSKLNPRFPRVWFLNCSRQRRAVASTEFLVLVAKPPCNNEFLFSLCKLATFHDTFLSLVTGTSSSHQRVKPDDLMSMKTICPPDDILSEFAQKISSLFDRIHSHKKQSLTLAAIRDALLPKLLSGEIRVKDTERFV